MGESSSLPGDSGAKDEATSPTSVQIDFSLTQPQPNENRSLSRVHASIEHASAGVITTEVSNNGFYARTFYPTGYFESDVVRLQPSWRASPRNLPGFESGTHQMANFTHFVDYDQSLSRGQRRLLRSELRSAMRMDTANNSEPPKPVLTIAQMNLLAPSVLLVAETKDRDSSDMSPTPRCSIVQGGNLIAGAARGTWKRMKKIGKSKTSSSSATSSRALRKDEVGETCVICLDDWGSDGQVVRTLPCGHTMHSVCLDEWVQIMAKCPVDNGLLQPTKTRDH